MRDEGHCGQLRRSKWVAAAIKLQLEIQTHASKRRLFFYIIKRYSRVMEEMIS
jgi:hypothetical protein